MCYLSSYRLLMFHDFIDKLREWSSLLELACRYYKLMCSHSTTFVKLQMQLIEPDIVRTKFYDRRWIRTEINSWSAANKKSVQKVLRGYFVHTL